MTVRAQIIQEYRDFARDRVRLLMREENIVRGFRYLLSDGTWTEWMDPEQAAGEKLEGIGIDLPRHALEAIGTALEEFAGVATHGPTAEKLLRETLEIERGRVDRSLDMLDRAMERRPEWVVMDADGIRKMGGGG